MPDSAQHSDEHSVSSDIPYRAESGASKDEERRGPLPPKENPPVLANGWGPYLKKTLAEMFLSKLNILMFLVPFSFISHFAEWGDGPTFVITLLALIPLAERISFVTEDFAKYANETLGGLMNATMGNVTEMIVSIFALKHGLLRVVQVSLIGSVLSNMLLVLGTAFLVGGIKHNTQRYNKAAAITNTGLLTLSVLAILFPAVLDATHENRSAWGTLVLSRLTALLTLFVYGFLIWYQLKTHKYLFEGQEEEEEEEPLLGFWGAITWMAIFTIFIAFLSEFIVAAIEGAAASLEVPVLFIGTILLPIVGNAAEHAAAIVFAYKNKMDLCVGIAVGSAAQISLFVIPFTVLVAWMMGRELSLDFHIFETAVLFMTVVLVSFCLQNGDSDWLKGAMLMVAYVLVSAAFWIHKDPPSEEGL
jgi:Ca2+:H+ antiporter